MTDKLICYCHHFSEQDIIDDVRAHGSSRIMEQIQAESKRGNCNCKINNPAGR